VSATGGGVVVVVVTAFEAAPLVLVEAEPEDEPQADTTSESAAMDSVAKFFRSNDLPPDDTAEINAG